MIISSWNVNSVSTLKEAREYLSELQPEIIVSDVFLPDGSGMEFTTELIEIAQNSLVILITGFPDLNNAIKSLGGNVYDYLLKPFKVEQLILEKTQLQEEHARVINNDHSNTNNITTIGRDQNIIIVNNFGEENIEHLLKDENFVKKCIESPINSIHRYLDNVHFDKEHPENRNIKMTNLLGPYMDYIKEGKWNKIEKNILIPKIIDKSIDTIDEIIDYSKEDSDDDIIDYSKEDSDDDVIDYNKDINDNKWKIYKSEKKKKKIKNKIIKKANRQIYNETQDIEAV